MKVRAKLRPEGAPGLTDKYQDWRDFTNKVARPWIEAEDDPRAEAWYRALMLAQDPYYLAVALVFADNRIRALESAQPVAQEKENGTE